MQGNGRIRGFFVGIALAGLASVHTAKVPSEDKTAVQPASPPKPDIYVEAYVTGTIKKAPKRSSKAAP